MSFTPATSPNRSGNMKKARGTKLGAREHRGPAAVVRVPERELAEFSIVLIEAAW